MLPGEPKVAGRVGQGAGESAAPVAEERRCEQIRRRVADVARVVVGRVLPGKAPRLLVERDVPRPPDALGRELFARARLARDEDWDPIEAAIPPRRVGDRIAPRTARQRAARVASASGEAPPIQVEAKCQARRA